MGRQPANTRIGQRTLKKIRIKGGGTKVRALRLNTGNFAWKSQAITKNLKITDVVYNATDPGMMRAKKLVKSAILEVDATPLKSWWECYYKKSPEEADAEMIGEEMKFQLGHGYLYACVTTRPGQVGMCDGYILEGDELRFYLQKIKSKH